MNFNYILNDAHDPRYNLALEEVLCEEAAKRREGFLMLWSNDPTVVVGRFQNTAQEVMREFIAPRGIHVVRRITGGGAVYHDRGNLNYSVILPSQDESRLDIQAFSVPLLQYLWSLGVAAEHTGRNDVTVKGCKISGVAQYAAAGMVLHHGTILFDSRLEDVERALRVKPEKYQSKGFRSVRSRVTNLLPHLPQKMTLERFQAGFAAALIRFYHAETVRPPTAAEALNAQELAVSKYASWNWTWGNSPDFTVNNERRFSGGTVQIGLVVKEGRVEDCRIYGDFFSLGTPGEVEARIRGQRYPFVGLEALLPDELLKRSFLSVSPGEFRAFLAE